jgi:hypothetical protein
MAPGNPDEAYWTTNPNPTLGSLGAPKVNTGGTLTTGTLMPGTNVIVTPGGAEPGYWGPGGDPEIRIANPGDHIINIVSEDLDDSFE